MSLSGVFRARFLGNVPLNDFLPRPLSFLRKCDVNGVGERGNVPFGDVPVMLGGLYVNVIETDVAVDKGIFDGDIFDFEFLVLWNVDVFVVVVFCPARFGR